MFSRGLSSMYDVSSFSQITTARRCWHTKKSPYTILVQIIKGRLYLSDLLISDDMNSGRDWCKTANVLPQRFLVSAILFYFIDRYLIFLHLSLWTNTSNIHLNERLLLLDFQIQVVRKRIPRSTARTTTLFHVLNSSLISFVVSLSSTASMRKRITARPWRPSGQWLIPGKSVS